MAAVSTAVPDVMDAAQRLGEVQQRIVELTPESAPPGPAQPTIQGKERERLALLQRAARHMAGLPPGAASDPSDAALLRAAELRRRAGAVLRRLGQHAAAEMPLALGRAITRWDQAGDVSLLSAAGRQAALEVQGAAQEALRLVLGARRRTPALLGLLAAAAETVVAVDAACALLRAAELRFAPLLRERLRRGGAGDTASQRALLLPGGVPFLDLGGALLAVAEAFGATEPAELQGDAETEAAA